MIDDKRYAYYTRDSVSYPVTILSQTSPKSVEVQKHDGVSYHGGPFWVRISSLDLKHPREKREELVWERDRAYRALTKAEREYNEAVHNLHMYDSLT